MALNVQTGTLIQPGADGNQTTNLAADFDPKALIVWTTPQTADGSIAHAAFSFGFATYRGSVVQQWYSTVRSQDAAAADDVSIGEGTGSLARLFSAGVTVDLDLDFVSFATGASSAFTVAWNNRHTTASIRVHYMVLGGSDITDAYVSSFAVTAAAATQDVTVVAGFGQPDLLLFSAVDSLSAADTDNSSVVYTLGAAKSDTERACTALNEEHGVASMTMGAWQKARAILFLDGTTQAAAAEADLSARAAWPTDGFELSYPDTAAFAYLVGYLALKGTFTSKIQTTTAPTSGGLPVVVDLAHGSAPTGALLFGNNLPTSTAIDTTHADLGAFGVGSLDGTNEAFAGWSQDDGNANADTADYNSTAKAWQNYSGVIATGLTSEADGSISGSNVRLSWNDIDTIARELVCVSFGSASAAAEDCAPIIGGGFYY